jgi:exonuclease SbcC
MKILELRFMNINSLYGEWAIDLTAPAYQSDGIFAITGPTGSGKSTLLDALCLALYGETPRLGKITRGGNEVMSRQTGSCYAEVTFATQSGRYRCHWSQHRARNKADGTLAEARHEITDADSGLVLETRKREVAALIEDKTGMDFGRFTRSILLAQGGFAAFLQASADERAPVLEQITGTEIYSELSIKAHERQRAERDALDELKRAGAALVLLDEQQAADLNQQLQNLEKQSADLTAEGARADAALAWLRLLATLRDDLTQLAAKEAALAQTRAVFAPKLEQLERAGRAAGLDGEHAQLDALRRQDAGERALQEREQARVPALTQNKSDRQTVVTAAGRQREDAQAQLTQAAPLLNQVRLLDDQIEGKEKELASQALEAEKASRQLTAQAAKLAELQQQIDDVQKQRGAAAAYLQQHTADENLVTQLTGITEQLRGLSELDKQLAAKEKETGKRRRELAPAQKSRQERAAARDVVLAEQTIVRTEQADLAEAGRLLLGNKTLPQYEAEKDALLRERAFLSKVADLEAERLQLYEGRPCPLCGATSHPYASGRAPATDRIDAQIGTLDALITRAKRQDDAARNLERRAGDLAARLGEAERSLLDAEHQRAEIEREVRRLTADAAELAERRDWLREVLLHNLQAWDPGGAWRTADTGQISAALIKRRDDWLAARTREQTLLGRAQEFDVALARLTALRQSQEQAKQVLVADIAARKAALAALRQQRQALFGEQDPAVVEARLQSAVRAADLAERQAGAQLAEAIEQLTALNARLAALADSIARRQPELLKQSAQFDLSLASAGFADAAAYLAGRLPAETRRELTEQARRLEASQTELTARLNDRRERLAQELARNLSQASQPDLEQRLQDISSEIRTANEQSGAIKQRLAEQARIRAEALLQRSRIEAQERVCRRWDRLRDLIGSADGKKLRNFAQGLTFEALVAQANQQLQKMTARYLLVRDDKLPLELNVVDNDQAGEIRSTKNLSGGESFIVSLALALGLSRMASRKVRVDSLFLDEGFGTLDEEALETALDTLAGLRGEGKLIGVISHVPALQERIATQICVRPLSGGRSALSGPGVSRPERPQR